MTAKEFLRQYGDCERRIQSRQRRIERLKEQSRSIKQTLSVHVQSSGGGDRQARIVESYVDMEWELEQEVRRSRAVQRQVQEVSSSLEDGRQRDVLERYYLEGMTFEQVAVDLNYSYKQTCRIHGRALLAVKDVLECPIQPVI